MQQNTHVCTRAQAYRSHFLFLCSSSRNQRRKNTRKQIVLSVCLFEHISSYLLVLFARISFLSFLHISSVEFLVHVAYSFAGFSLCTHHLLCAQLKFNFSFFLLSFSLCILPLSRLFLLGFFFWWKKKMMILRLVHLCFTCA